MRRTASLLIVTALAALGLALPAAALATPDTDTNSQRATPGADCTGSEGRQVTIRTRGNGRQVYRCEHRAGDGYGPRWHRVNTPAPSSPGDGYGPVPSTPASSPAPSASKSPSASPRPDTPAGPQLPVTGPAIWIVVVVGGVLVLAGIRLLVVGMRRTG